MIKPIITLLLFITTTYAHGLCLQLANDSDFPESLVTGLNEVGIHSAWYDGATDRYAHGVLGDAIEASILLVSINAADGTCDAACNKTGDGQCQTSITLNDNHVFEDITPRLANIDNKPGAEVITVRSHKNKGAQIAVYTLGTDNTLQLLTTTPYIGTANRWLAPVGIADFDNNGHTDIAFIDRPHLAKTLSVWSYKNDTLEHVASQQGFSNHKIGQDFISGGLRHCLTKIDNTEAGNFDIEMITADASWQRVLATRLVSGELISRDIGPFVNTMSLTAALKCP